jgi:hypothetical protein
VGRQSSVAGPVADDQEAATFLGTPESCPFDHVTVAAAVKPRLVDVDVDEPVLV